MPICEACGNKKLFIQHGYPKDGTVRMSCKVCKSNRVKNTFVENFFWSLEQCIIICIFFPFAVLLISLLWLCGKTNDVEKSGNNGV